MINYDDISDDDIRIIKRDNLTEWDIIPYIESGFLDKCLNNINLYLEIRPYIIKYKDIINSHYYPGCKYDNVVKIICMIDIEYKSLICTSIDINDDNIDIIEKYIDLYKLYHPDKYTINFINSANNSTNIFLINRYNIDLTYIKPQYYHVKYLDYLQKNNNAFCNFELNTYTFNDLDLLLHLYKYDEIINKINYYKINLIPNIYNNNNSLGNKFEDIFNILINCDINIETIVKYNNFSINSKDIKYILPYLNPDNIDDLLYIFKRLHVCMDDYGTYRSLFDFYNIDLTNTTINFYNYTYNDGNVYILYKLGLDIYKFIDDILSQPKYNINKFKYIFDNLDYTLINDKFRTVTIKYLINDIIELLEAINMGDSNSNWYLEYINNDLETLHKINNYVSYNITDYTNNTEIIELYEKK